MGTNQLRRALENHKEWALDYAGDILSPEDFSLENLAEYMFTYLLEEELIPADSQYEEVLDIVSGWEDELEAIVNEPGEPTALEEAMDDLRRETIKGVTVGVQYSNERG